MTFCSPSRKREGVGGRDGSLAETVACGPARPRPPPPPPGGRGGAAPPPPGVSQRPLPVALPSPNPSRLREGSKKNRKTPPLNARFV